MAQDGIPSKGEAAALVRAGAARAASAPRWLAELKAEAGDLRERRERPAGKPFGRWLGDFLVEDTPSGLLPAEEKLLFAAAAGEPCVLAPRAGRLWSAFESWKKTAQAPQWEDVGFVAAMSRFTAAAPEAVQDVIIEATRHAVAELQLPQYWEPKDEGEVERFAAAQRAYLAWLEAEANPAQSIEQAKKSPEFYELALEVAIEALTPKPYLALKLKDKSLNGLLRADPLGLSVETRAKVRTQPRVLRDFFDELVREAKRAPVYGDGLAGKLKVAPKALRPLFDAAFERYERERWRWADPEDPEVRLRAAFLRFLALGGDASAPVHESRLELHGAAIAEDLDLSGCTIPQPLVFSRCVFGRVSFKGAVTKSLDFPASRAGFIDAENAHIQGGVFLRNAFRANGVSFPYAAIDGRFSGEGGVFLSSGAFAIDAKGAEINGDADLGQGFLGEGGVFFTGAKIGGTLNCAGGAFRNRTEDGSGVAFGCDGAAISSGAALANGFRSEGVVSFSGAKIGGGLDCTKGAFANRTANGAGEALTVENAVIGSNVSLRHGFAAEGQVRFNGARVGGDFYCGGGRFENAAHAKKDGNLIWDPRVATALNLQGAKIDGTLWLGPPAQDGRAAARILGSVKLGCEARQIVDNPGCWPPKKVRVAGGKKLPAFIYLDGLTYDRFVYGDYDAATRKRWLDRQPSGHLGVSFRPQPFEQLVKVYREMGQDREARSIAKFKESRRYRSLFVKLWRGWRDRPRLSKRFGGKARYASPLDFIAWPLTLAWRTVSRAAASIPLGLAWAFAGFGTAYWYGWGRLVAFLLLMWIGGGALYYVVAAQGGFAPSNPAIYLNEKLAAKCGKNWTTCKGAPPELPGFSPYLYSLDIMLPVLDLGQKRDWQPMDRPDAPVQLDLPALTWLPKDDPHYSAIPDFDIARQPIGEGGMDAIVRTQTLLSWGALGLLIAMLSGLIKKD